MTNAGILLGVSAQTRTSPIAFLTVPFSAVPSSTACAIHPLAILQGACPVPSCSLSSSHPALHYQKIVKCVESIERQRGIILHTMICRNILPLEIPSHSVDSFLHKSIDCSVSTNAHCQLFSLVGQYPVCPHNPPPSTWPFRCLQQVDKGQRGRKYSHLKNMRHTRTIWTKHTRLELAWFSPVTLS